MPVLAGMMKSLMPTASRWEYHVWNWTLGSGVSQLRWSVAEYGEIRSEKVTVNIGQSSGAKLVAVP